MLETALSILVLGIIVSTMYMLISTGFTIIYSVGNILDLSYFGFLMIGGYSYILLYKFVPAPFSLIIAMAVTSLLYLLMYKLLIKRLLYDPIMVAVITVLFNLVLEYILTLIFSRAERILFPVVPGVAEMFGIKFHKNMFLVLALSLLIMVGFLFFVKKTFAGMSILALSMDRKGAVLSGVNPDRTLSVVYIISGLMAGLSGVNYGAYTAVYPEMFLFPLIIVLAISLIGGLGSIKGTIIGSLIIGFLEIITTYLWDPKARGIAALFAILVILYIRPRGLFGREVKF